jgi:hypothetical protein
MGRWNATIDEAEANGYKRGAHNEIDKVRDVKKYVPKTKKGPRPNITSLSSVRSPGRFYVLSRLSIFFLGYKVVLIHYRTNTSVA